MFQLRQKKFYQLQFRLVTPDDFTYLSEEIFFYLFIDFATGGAPIRVYVFIGRKKKKLYLFIGRNLFYLFIDFATGGATIRVCVFIGRKFFTPA